MKGGCVDRLRRISLVTWQFWATDRTQVILTKKSCVHFRAGCTQSPVARATVNGKQEIHFLWRPFLPDAGTVARAIYVGIYKQTVAHGKRIAAGDQAKPIGPLWSPASKRPALS
jgi:hypothetical protein